MLRIAKQIIFCIRDAHPNPALSVEKDAKQASGDPTDHPLDETGLVPAAARAGLMPAAYHEQD